MLMCLPGIASFYVKSKVNGMMKILMRISILLLNLLSSSLRHQKKMAFHDILTLIYPLSLFSRFYSYFMAYGTSTVHRKEGQQ